MTEMASPAPAAPPEPTSRAGRNLTAAVAVGVGLGALVVVSLVFDRRAFVAVVVVAMAVAHLELSAAVRTAGIRVMSLPVLLGGTAMLIGAYPSGTDLITAFLGVTVVLVLFWRLFDGAGPDGYVRDASASLFTLLYAPFLACFAVLMLREDDGAWRIVVFVVVTICSDIGGYAVGVLIGKHPMAPSISPKKSWEGFAGSALFCVLGGVLTVAFLLDGTWWAGAILGACIVVSATLGDLAESLVKRDLGIKDMGTLLPGHGGLMDRLDSLLPSAPVAWGLLSLLVPVAS
jgi:phosphatidate cytidylyltransferase